MRFRLFAHLDPVRIQSAPFGLHSALPCCFRHHSFPLWFELATFGQHLPSFGHHSAPLGLYPPLFPITDRHFTSRCANACPKIPNGSMSPTGASWRLRVCRAEGPPPAWSQLHGASGWACEWGVARGLGEAASQPSSGVEHITYSLVSMILGTPPSVSSIKVTIIVVWLWPPTPTRAAELQCKFGTSTQTQRDPVVRPSGFRPGPAAGAKRI